MSIRVTIASKEDAPLIADMSRITFYETFVSQNTKEDMDKFMKEQFTREALIKEVEDGADIFLLAYHGQEPVGYVRMREGEKRPEFEGLPSIEIARIYAMTAAIGKGVGATLMNECLQIASALGKKVIWLGVWEKNQRAIHFYHKWGFKEFAKHDFLLGNDVQTDWLMKRML